MGTEKLTKGHLDELPLSWYLSSDKISEVKKIKLPFLRSIWLSTGPVANLKDAAEYFIDIDNKKYLFIRGINKRLSETLNDYGFKSYLVSREAILKLGFDHFEKKSLKELIRRGLRHGQIVEKKYTQTNIVKLSRLIHHSAHSEEPQLQNLFLTELTPDYKLFVFEDKKGDWLGALMLSRNSDYKYHTELILRKKHAPVGIMEALVYQTFLSLKNSGALYLSLGEVPFREIEKNNLSGLEKTINDWGKFFNFAYNSEGLFHFKNKFNPFWENIYVCAKPKLNFTMLISLSINTNFLNLILYKIIAQ